LRGLNQQLARNYKLTGHIESYTDWDEQLYNLAGERD